VSEKCDGLFASLQRFHAVSPTRVERIGQRDPAKLAAAALAEFAILPAAEFGLLLAEPVYWGLGVPRGDRHSVLVSKPSESGCGARVYRSNPKRNEWFLEVYIGRASLPAHAAADVSVLTARKLAIEKGGSTGPNRSPGQASAQGRRQTGPATGSVGRAAPGHTSGRTNLSGEIEARIRQ